MIKMFALVVSGLFLPVAVQAEAVFFGNINADYTISDANNFRQYQLNDEGTRVGIKGARYLNDVLQASYILETATALAAEDDLIGEVRQAWLGLRGTFGEIRVGRHLSPGRVALEPIDLFMHQAADQNTVLESDVLHDKSIAYINRKNNIGYALAFSTDDNNSRVSTDLLVNYNTKPLYLAGAYLKGSDKRNTLRLGGSYQFPAGHQIGAAVEHLDDRVGNSGHSAYVLNAAYRMNKVLLKGQLGRNQPEVAGHDETLIGIGVDYDIRDSMVLRAQYSINAHRDHSANDENRVFSLGISYHF